MSATGRNSAIGCSSASKPEAPAPMAPAAPEADSTAFASEPASPDAARTAPQHADIPTTNVRQIETARVLNKMPLVSTTGCGRFSRGRIGPLHLAPAPLGHGRAVIDGIVGLV